MFASVAVVGVFTTRLVDLQLVRADALSKQADQSQMGTATVYGNRGDIVDANGVVLAHTPERWDIQASPSAFASWSSNRADPGVVTKGVAKLAAATGTDAAALTAALTADPKSDYAMLVKSVDLAALDRVKALDLPWVYPVTDQSSRIYPQGATAGNLVGFMNTDGPGAGLELSANSCLAGSNGTSTYLHGRDWVQIPGSQTTTKPAKDGGTLHLTIDSDLQWYAQQIIEQQKAAEGAQWATAAVVDVRNGHLLAAAQTSTVDPNDVNATDTADLGARFFSSPYEPGSIMKPATVASLIDAGKLTPYDKVDVPARYAPPSFPKGASITDVFVHPDEHWTATGIIEQSSNIGISVISERLPVAQRTAYLEKFGFGSKTAVDFSGESAGIVQNPATIDPISDKAQQFGQGISVTSAQMAGLYQTLGNGGVRLPLTLVSGCTHDDGTTTDVPSTTGERVVSTQAADETLEMMETVAEFSNISKIVTIPGYRIAAKTGTAQVADPTTHAYGADRVVSVAGISTVDNPEYAVIVTLGEPSKIKSSLAAAPAWAAIMKQVIKTYRVPPSTTTPPNLPLTW